MTYQRNILSWVPFQLASDLEDPLHAGRHFRQLLVPNSAPIGGLNWVADIVSTTTQVGTHLDALCHLRRGGRSTAAMPSPTGRPVRLQRHGIETVPQIVTRGWLVDARGGRRHRARRARRHRARARRRRALPHGLGRALGRPRALPVRRAGARLRGRALARRRAASRSPAATPGATGRSRPRIPSGRSRCRRSSTCVTACSSSRTSTSRRSPPTACASSPDPHPSQAARRHRRVDVADRPRLSGGTMEHFDVIIIGTGAGGGTLAHRLAPSGKRILLLERGGYLPREPENWDSHEVFNNDRYLSGEQWLDKDGAAVPAPPAVLRRRQHEVLRRDPVPPARARLRRRSATTAASRPRGRSPTRTSSPTTRRPSGSTSCTGRRERTRPSRGARATSRTRRSRTSRASSSCTTTSSGPAIHRSTCPSASTWTRRIPRPAAACAATASTASRAWPTARPTRTCCACGRR